MCCHDVTELVVRCRVTMQERPCLCRHTDLEKLANGELGDVEEVLPQEDPTYQDHMQSHR